MKTFRIKSTTAIAACITTCLLAVPLSGRAALVTGGSSLLNQADADQLETWLGQGSITLNNIFTRTTGDGKSSYDFHVAADGKGATFSVIEVLDTQGNAHQIIGGYNPQSWYSAGDFYHLTPTDAERTAFLFNLSTSSVQNQKLIADDMYGVGIYQTYNGGSYGPTFGGGHDLYVRTDLSGGYANNYSYGVTTFGNNITGVPFTYDYWPTPLQYGTIEIFTINAAPVPEPSTFIAGALLALPFGLQGFRWLRNRKQVA